MIKVKQISSFVTAICFMASVLVSFGVAGGNTAQAYTCSDPNEPTAIYEYHESDGMCWKVRYTDRQISPPNATCKDGNCSCPNNQPFVLNGQCKQNCPAGDQYHADNNSCWYQNGYTGNGGQVQPTNNDGTAIASDNSACVDGFIYLPNGNGTKGPGCYDRAGNGTFPCGPDQDVKVSGFRGASQSCGDAVKKHLVPKNTAQSADKTSLNKNCESKYSGADQKEQLAVCQAKANNPSIDCSKQPNQVMKDACNASTAKPNPGGGNPGSSGTSKCGQAETNLISCADDGNAIASILKIIVSVLTVIIGIAATGGLAWAAILYAKAEDNAGNVSEAKELIRNIVIGLFLYIFMVAIINWLVPGGVIGG